MFLNCVHPVQHRLLLLQLCLQDRHVDRVREADRRREEEEKEEETKAGKIGANRQRQRRRRRQRLERQEGQKWRPIFWRILPKFNDAPAAISPLLQPLPPSEEHRTGADIVDAVTLAAASIPSERKLYSESLRKSSRSNVNYRRFESNDNFVSSSKRIDTGKTILDRLAQVQNRNFGKIFLFFGKKTFFTFYSPFKVFTTNSLSNFEKLARENFKKREHNKKF